MWPYAYKYRQNRPAYPSLTSVSPSPRQTPSSHQAQNPGFIDQFTRLYESPSGIVLQGLRTSQPTADVRSPVTRRFAAPQSHSLSAPDSTYHPPSTDSSTSGETLSGSEYPEYARTAPMRLEKPVRMNSKAKKLLTGKTKERKKPEDGTTKKRVQPPRRSASKVLKTGFYDVKATFREMANKEEDVKKEEDDPAINMTKSSSSDPIYISSENDEDEPLLLSRAAAPRESAKKRRLPPAPTFCSNTSSRLDPQIDAHRLTEQLERLHQELEDHDRTSQAKLNIANHTIAQLEKAIGDKNSELSKMNETLRTAEKNSQHWQTQARELSAKLKDAEKANQRAEHEVQDHRECVQSLHTERDELQAKCDQHVVDLSEKQKEINKLKEDCDKWQSDWDSFLRNHEPNNIEITTLQEELAVAQNGLRELRESRRARRQNSTSSQGSSKSPDASLGTENSRLKADLAKEKLQLEEFMSNLAKVEAATRDSYNAKIATLEATITEIRTANANLMKVQNKHMRNNTFSQAQMSTPPYRSSPIPATHPLSPAPAYLPSASSSDTQTATDNVRNTFLKNKRKYDRLVSIASKVTSATAGWDLTCVGELGDHLWQMKQALENRDD